LVARMEVQTYALTAWDLACEAVGAGEGWLEDVPDAG
jgi:hypothetical protein